MNIVLCSREEEERILSHGVVLCTEDEVEILMHYGIKGQKHGERRWQNPDGSLTPEGYIHYGIGQGNKHKAKAEKLDAKVQKAQSKLDKQLSKSSSVVGRVFGNKEKQNAKEQKLKRKLEVAQAKQRLEEDKAKKQEERGMAKFERDKEREAFEKRNTLTEEDKVSIEEHDKAGTEFTGDDEHDDALRNVSEKAIKEKIQFIKDWYNDEIYVNKEEREVNLEHNINYYESGELSDEERKDFGDDILSYADEESKKIQAKFNPGGKWDYKSFDDINDTEEYKTYNAIQNWITDKVYEKSGSWNAGEYKKGSNAEKASNAYNKASDDIGNLWDNVSKETGYTWGKDYGKLKKAVMSNDKWPALNKAYAKAEGDLCGAMLKDLGFKDTPANRYLIIQFAFID